MNTLEYCNKLHQSTKSFAFHFKIKKDKMEEKIIHSTKFLNDNRISTRVYCITNHIKTQPKCECGKDLKFNQYSEGFREFCSVKCSANSKSKQEKIKQTNLKKYGCVNTFQTDNGRKAWDEFQSNEFRVKEAVAKGQHSLKENYGVDTIEEATKLRYLKSIESNIENNGFHFTNRAKAQLSRNEEQMVANHRKTCLAKYGVENHMQTTQGFENYLKSTFKRKNYIFPSGRVDKIQGFENIALDNLLKEYNEDEIITDTKLIPTIWYVGEDNKKHRYYPDIFIPKDNLIIEVKSDYTMRANFYVNMLKGSACKKEGFSFKYLVYGNKGKALI